MTLDFRFGRLPLLICFFSLSFATVPLVAQNNTKILHFNIQVEPTTIDPQRVSEVPEIAATSLNYEALFEVDETGHAVPAAAEDLKISSDGLIYTVVLRDGLTYSDGTPLTAYNYQYAFKRLFDPTLPGRPQASTAYVIRGAKELSELQDISDQTKLKALQDALGVKATDKRTIVFQLEEPAAYFPYILASYVGYPVREDLVDRGGANWASNDQGTFYVGNGPFILRTWNHGSGMVWDANPRYRKGRPKIDQLDIREIGDHALAYQAYLNGELDLVSLSADNIAAVKGDPELQGQYAEVSGSTGFLVFNTRIAPFNNVKVRQAFTFALDRNDYVDVVLNGAGKPADSLIPPGSPGYSPNIRQGYFNPQHAKQLLGEAGYPDGNGLPDITLTYPTGRNFDLTIQWLQDQLQQNLGVVVRLEPMEANSYYSLFSDSTKLPQLWFSGYSQRFPDPQNWLSAVFRSDAGLFPTGWKNDQFDTITRQADSEANAERRSELYEKAHQILADDAPVVFMNWYVNGYLIRPYVTGMREHASANDFAMPGFTNIVNIDVVDH